MSINFSYKKYSAIDILLRNTFKKTYHDLRHTATSRLAEKLPNVIELAAVTGHQTIQMLKRYYHPKAEALAQKLG